MADEQIKAENHQSMETQADETAVAMADAALEPDQDMSIEFIRQINEEVRLQREQAKWQPYPSQAAPQSASLLEGNFYAKMVATVGIVLVIGTASTGAAYLALKKTMPPQPKPVTIQEKLAARGVPLTLKSYFEQIGMGQQEIVKMFLEAGIPVDSRRITDEYTPLILATHYGNAAMVQILLEHGADINAMDKNGQTALMKAVTQGHTKLAEKLLAAGADWRVKDKNGESALDIARRKRQYVIERKLRGMGAIESGSGDRTAGPGAAAHLPEQQIRTVSKKRDDRREQIAAQLVATKQPERLNRSDAVDPDQQPAKPNFLLKVGQAGPFSVGMSLNAVPRGLPVTRIRENHTITSVFYDQVEPSVVLSHSQGARNAVANIIIYDQRFKTEKGIGVNSSLGELRQAYPSLVVRYYGEGYVKADVPEIAMHFEMDIDLESITHGGTEVAQPGALPDGMRVRRILIF